MEVKKVKKVKKLRQLPAYIDKKFIKETEELFHTVFTMAEYSPQKQPITDVMAIMGLTTAEYYVTMQDALTEFRDLLEKSEIPHLISAIIQHDNVSYGRRKTNEEEERHDEQEITITQPRELEE